MIMSSSFAPTQNAENGFIAGTNPKWSSLLGGVIFRSLPPVLNMIPVSEIKNDKKQKTDYQLKKEGSDISQILTRKPPIYRGIKTPQEAQRVYGGSGTYIIGQSLT